VTDAGGGGVKPRKAALRHHAGQIGQAHAERGELFVIQSAGHLDRSEPARCADLVLYVGDPRRLKRQEFTQTVNRSGRIMHPFGDQIDAEIRSVGCKRGAVAIKDPASARGYQSEIDAVAFGFETVFLILGDRQIAQP